MQLQCLSLQEKCRSRVEGAERGLFRPRKRRSLDSHRRPHWHQRLRLATELGQSLRLEEEQRVPYEKGQHQIHDKPSLLEEQLRQLRLTLAKFVPGREKQSGYNYS